MSRETLADEFAWLLKVSKQTQLPTEEGERKAIAALKEDERDAEAWGWLIEHFAMLVAKIAARSARRWDVSWAVKDCFTAGCEGLRKAAVKFDSEKADRLSTYATYWIKQATRREAIRQRFQVSRPEYYAQRLVTKREEVAHDRTTENNEQFKIDRDRVLEEGLHSLEVPLNRHVRGEGFSFDDVEIINGHRPGDYETEERELHERLAREELLEKLKSMCKPQEWEVLRLRAEGLYLREIGERLGGVSRQHVEQIEKAALKKLRDRGERLWKEYNDAGSN